MKCPKCGSESSIMRNRCEICGVDLTVFRKTSIRSNVFYNYGLDKAKVRDLSGAVLMLKKSLEMNKRNTNARNLLGLVYFEMGETVAALSEWVVSKHFQPEGNEADRYMDCIQSNPTKLDSLNQAVKKYNVALEAARQHNYDLAVIQLKKVLSLNSHFIRALQLLALLYIRNKDYERARRYLSKAGKIDISNTTTLRYLQEINNLLSGSDIKQEEGTRVVRTAAQVRQEIEPVSHYREDKPNIMAWVNLFLGMVVGIAFTFLLIVPTAKNNIREEYEKGKMDYNSEMMVKMAALTSKDKEIEALKLQLEEKEKALANAKAPEADLKLFQNFISVIVQFQDFNNKGGADRASEKELIAMTQALVGFNPAVEKNKDAGKLIKQMREAVYEKAGPVAYDLGYAAFEKGDYEKALEYMLLSYTCNSESDATLYYLGKTYQELEDAEKAAEFYNALLDKFPESTLAGYTRTRLNELGL